MAERRPVRSRPRPVRDEEEEDREYEYEDEPEDEGNEVEDGDSRPPPRSRSGEERRRPRRPARPSGDGPLTAAKAGRLGLQQISELTGKPTEGVTWVERSDDAGWAVGVEVVEDRRIPSASDILAIYETEMDAGGELLSYRRVRRYSRGRGDEGSGSLEE